VKNPHISKIGQPIDRKFLALLWTTNAASWVVQQHCTTNPRWRPTPYWIFC